MTDPLDALRAPVTPADPDPAFAARLRARLERALGLPEGVAVTELTPTEHETSAPPLPGAVAEPAGTAPLRRGDISYVSVWVPDVARAAAFYGAVLGLEYLPAHNDRGRQAPGVVPPLGLWPDPAGPALFCSYVVDAAAAAVARVRAAGGRAEEPMARPYGLTADCVDPDGIRFALHQPFGSPGPAQPRAGAAAGRDGDLAYLTLEVPDAARTLEFYGAVLGWRSHPGRSPGGWQVEDTTPMIGVSGGHAAPAAVPVWQVSDVAAAVARVLAAGGTSTQPHREPYGLMAECTDDQGTRFSLGQFPS
jgi:predicted enzyme related to lactoylglutathione lyase